MTQVFSGKTVSALCKGEITYSINVKERSVTAVFKDTKPSNKLCAVCDFKTLCLALLSPQFDPEQKTIQVLAFSGMPIGELPIIKETPTMLEVVTRKGVHLKFDRKTGQQLNAKDKRWANKIEITK